MVVLVTGAAGFIGYHTAIALLDRGERVIGVDNFNHYYDVSLKEARYAQLETRPGFEMHRIDISDRPAMEHLVNVNSDIDGIIHLAAQAGVRYSLENPYAYIQSNVVGQMVMLELARNLPRLRHMVYASSSSVYGGNTKLPFTLEDPVDHPVSLYAATKRSDELMGHCYSHLYRIPMSGLRFFTVYGRWGRPDMAAFIFTKAILEGRPIKVFNHGDMKRDFTHISDIVSGILGCLDRPPAAEDGAPHKLYNLGNNTPEPLMRFIKVIERSTNQKAEIDFEPMQPGDVHATYADISALQEAVGFKPDTPIKTGLGKFVDWYRQYYKA